MILGRGVAVCLLLSAHRAVIFAIARLSCFTDVILFAKTKTSKKFFNSRTKTFTQCRVILVENGYKQCTRKCHNELHEKVATGLEMSRLFRQDQVQDNFNVLIETPQDQGKVS